MVADLNDGTFNSSKHVLIKVLKTGDNLATTKCAMNAETETMRKSKSTKNQNQGKIEIKEKSKSRKNQNQGKIKIR